MKTLNPKITDWQGMKVWVIGASSGIGEALANQLQKKGAKLALSARRLEPLRQMANPDDKVLPLDAGDGSALQSAHEQLLSAWESIDLVVYCAGTYAPMRAWDLDLSTVQKTFEINLHGAYNLLAAIVPVFIQRGTGGICLVGSVAGYTGLPKALAYSPSKAAMISLAEVLYTDLAPRGIGVYLVNPGFVKTRLTKQNDFDMPALTTPDVAASEIIAGMERGEYEIHFPKRFTRWMKILAILPDRLRFALIGKVGQS